ncbi:serine hydrolase domain-containing protein [Bythopirellula goksoeyrii]|uniref:Esterase EstB n=1 Tax=Bythopirellula goksoeyrii TaxID=1400387 RepID=A0A5B9QJS1_9BACT|nr:serine hydrolase domain-containing protein [Bythopirellula goksoeyrii]QEG37830.1 Esterase EstB [Bythopirellula goksoeyrii]
MHFRTIFLFNCLAILFLTNYGLAQQLPTVSPEEVGMSSQKLAKISEVMQQRVEDGEIVGGSVLVARRGKVVFFEQFGHMDAEAQKPWQADTIVRIYSMTKSITTAAALMLVEEGKLALDDPVEKYLPELADRTVYDEAGNQPAKSAMTIQQLMTHTSGLIYGNPEGSPVERLYAEEDLLDRNGTLQDVIDKLSGLPLIFDPGTDWHYGTSTDVLGAVVERVSGKPLDAFLSERIFEPLGMVDTAFQVPPEKLDRFAVCYEQKEGKWTVEDDPATSRYARPATFLSGGGGLVSTASDYWRFFNMIAAGGEAGGKRFLKPETVALMTHNQLDDKTGWADDPGAGFGLGFRVVCKPIPAEDRRLLGEYGWGGMASTQYWANPREEFTVVTLEQSLPYRDSTFVVANPLVYDAIVEGK